MIGRKILMILGEPNEVEREFILCFAKSMYLDYFALKNEKVARLFTGDMTSITCYWGELNHDSLLEESSVFICDDTMGIDAVFFNYDQLVRFPFNKIQNSDDIIEARRYDPSRDTWEPYIVYNISASRYGSYDYK